MGYREIAGDAEVVDLQAQGKRTNAFKSMHQVSKLMPTPIKGLSPQQCTLLTINKSDNIVVRRFETSS